MKFIAFLFFITLCLTQCKSQPKTQKVGQTEIKLNNKMVFLIGGKFISSNNLDTAEVFIDPFLIDMYEVTVADFAQFVQITGYVTDTEKPGASSLIRRGGRLIDMEGVCWKDDEQGHPRSKEDYDYPVVHVSYNDAIAFAEWVNKRLPTIYEWEYAAVTGKVNPEENFTIDKFEWYSDNSGLRIHKGGEKRANGNGLYDMLGNVIERIELPKENLTHLIGNGDNLLKIRGAKGGSFYEDKVTVRRTVLGNKNSASGLCGFRCAKDTIIVK